MALAMRRCIVRVRGGVVHRVPDVYTAASLPCTVQVLQPSYAVCRTIFIDTRMPHGFPLHTRMLPTLAENAQVTRNLSRFN